MGAGIRRWPLVGREKELNTLTEALGPGGSFLIYGQAGVGKTRLAEEYLAWAEKSGISTARATATVTTGAVPLGAIMHMIPAGIDLHNPIEGLSAFSRALSGMYRNRLVVLIDDLHLLDSTSAIVLRYLLDQRVMQLIGTIRSGESVSDAVGMLIRDSKAHRVDLSELSAEQVEKILQGALGGAVRKHTAQVLHKASGGNPLYLRELVAGAVARQRLTKEGGVWGLVRDGLPKTNKLTELVCSRLEAAGPAGRPVLDLLSLCQNISLHDARVYASEQCLMSLQQAGLIEVVQEHRRTKLSLAHPMYSEVLRARMPALRTRQLLLEQVQRVETYGVRRRDDALHVAAWRLAATGVADPQLLHEAALLAHYAHDYSQVVSLLTAIPDCDHTSHSLSMLGQALSQMGHWTSADAALEKAASRAVEENQRLTVALARSVNSLWGNASVNEAISHNQTHLAASVTSDHRRILTVNEGFIRTVAGQPAKGLPLLETMGNDIRSAPDVDIWLRGAQARSISLALTGRTAEAISWARHAYSMRVMEDEKSLVSQSAVQKVPLILALAEHGSLTEARSLGTSVFNELADSGTVMRAWTAVFTGRAEWLAGRPMTARRWYAEAAILARSMDHVRALQPALSGLAACAAVLGDVRGAQAAIDEHRTAPPVAPGFFSPGEENLGEAWLLCFQGHVTQARAVLLEAADIARGTEHATSEAMFLTDVARLGGATDVSQRLVALAETCESNLVAARARLVAAFALESPAELVEVSDELEEMGAYLLASEACMAGSLAWRRKGNARSATAALQQSLRLASYCEGSSTPLLTSSHVLAPLSRREREVALLAASGTRSKQIAETLNVSVRTVDNHLQHAYSKLGITARSELAALLRPARALDLDRD
ncbi:LuxR C-terminal-related transcriptional regulator [Streptomyces sp. NPDC093595]|uniref:LuxR C-terminal-related transcriptional regulator n=1 Tax=Streptomyces sp. NPDC093595 TaxID=3366045 RepID=UPI00380ED235